MAFEAIKNSALPRALGDSVANLADLVQKEFRLARAEISEKLATKASGAGFLAAAALFGLVAVVLFLQAVIFAIASYGVGVHWAASIVGVAVLVVGGILFAIGRAKLAQPLTPTRTVNQLNKDLSLVKEPLR
jgi:uncharacterized membrane protein YqjE